MNMRNTCDGNVHLQAFLCQKLIIVLFFVKMDGHQGGIHEHSWGDCSVVVENSRRVPRLTAVGEHWKYTGGGGHLRTDAGNKLSAQKNKEQKPMTCQAVHEELLGVPVVGPARPPTQGHFPVPTNKRQKATQRRKQGWAQSSAGQGLSQS